MKIMMSEMEKKVAREQWKMVFSNVIGWFVSTAFILWGWTVLAPHLNAPLFTYWEVFAMRMGFSYVMALFWQRK